MNASNPYESPEASGPSAEAAGRLLLWSVATVFGCVLLGGLLGLLIGAGLGSFAPGNYRSVFSHGSDPGFDPLAVGIGQGLTQGVVFGGFLGLAVVGMFHWLGAKRRDR